MTNFIPHTSQEREEMLRVVGADSVAGLFQMIPESLHKPIQTKHLPKKGYTELELQQHLTQVSYHNSGAFMESFQGGGAYHRFIPPAVNTIAGRSEFYTAYTPYQPEVSQGTLQMIYEFQTMMSELTGMDVTNASVYDGASALAEAALMALRATRRHVVACAKTVNPQYAAVLKTYIEALPGMSLVFFDPAHSLEKQMGDHPKSIAAVLIQQPDYFGCLHGSKDVQAFCDKTGAMLVVSVDPTTLGVLEPPSAYGAQIVCGDIQPFGNPVNYGGPYGGFVSTTEKLLRQLPGRVVGRTIDKDSKTAYTLTLQTREQHIRREKATSNICTNQSLNVLKATVYLSLIGPQGLRHVAEVSAERAHQLADALCQQSGVSMRFGAKPFFV